MTPVLQALIFSALGLLGDQVRERIRLRHAFTKHLSSKATAT
jgi:hypothetical protein